MCGYNQRPRHGLNLNEMFSGLPLSNTKVAVLTNPVLSRDASSVDLAVYIEGI